MNNYVQSAKLDKLPWDPVDTTKINFRESLTLSYKDIDICGVPATDFMSIVNAMVKEEIEKLDYAFVMTAIFYGYNSADKLIDILLTENIEELEYFLEQVNKRFEEQNIDRRFAVPPDLTAYRIRVEQDRERLTDRWNYIMEKFYGKENSIWNY